MPARSTSPAAPWPLGTLPSLALAPPARMHAVVLHRDRYGPPAQALRVEQIEAPCLGVMDAKKVLVAVLATGPNFNTNFAALGLPVPIFGRGDTASVHVPGSDACGIVVDAGPAVTRVKVGRAVLLDSWTGRNIRGYETHDGFNAQIVAIEEERAIPVPEALLDTAPEVLAPLLLTYGTAYRAVVERLQVGPQDTILVMGGGKGTSFPGAQLAKLCGARVVLIGSNPALGSSLVQRGFADAFVDRRGIPAQAFGPIEPTETYSAWEKRTEPFRAAVLAAAGGNPVTKIFEHTGGDNFPLLVSCLAPGGAIAFFGATGRGRKGEYRETFFYDGARFVFDARWVWMRQKQILFRKKAPGAIFQEIGLPPGRRGMIWGADAYARSFAEAALARGAHLAVVASRSRERAGIARLLRMGIPETHLLDRDAFDLPPDMPDPLTADGAPNPAYASGFLKKAQALGKALWGIFGPRTSPDFVVERTDQSTLHFSTFVARDFDETEAMQCGYVVARGKTDLTIAGSHMYCAAQAAEVVRLLASGGLKVEPGDIEVTDLSGLPEIQQKMLDGKMAKPKGVSLVQADRAGRSVRFFEDAFLGERVRAADPRGGKFIEIRFVADVAFVTLCRPDALNALNQDLLDQLSAVVRELRSLGTIDGRRAAALVLSGAGRAFVAGADVNEFLAKSADAVQALAAQNIGIFSDIERLSIPVVALVDGYALGGGNELAMSAHYRIVTENAVLGQPEVKLGIIPGYGGMQRLPRLVGPARAALLCANGEPVDGPTAVETGLADAFHPSARALLEAFRAARGAVDGTRPLPRRNWDEIAARQARELSDVLSHPAVRSLLADGEVADPADPRAARAAAARVALQAMEFGYKNGFSAGLANDARLFGAVTASPSGQEWIRRFLAKDPLQAAPLEVLPPLTEEG